MSLRITVMHDHECHPLWVDQDRGPRVNTAPEDLGVSPGLAGRLAAWARWGDSRLNLADSHDSRAVSLAEEAAFDEEARLLAERLAAELKDADVAYSKDRSQRG